MELILFALSSLACLTIPIIGVITWLFTGIWYVIARLNEPETVSKGYLKDNDGWKWGLQIVEFYRKKDDLPIWVVPWLPITDSDIYMLVQANKLYYEAKAAIERRKFSGGTKKFLIKQMALMPQNIANALWKLASLRRMNEAHYRNENKELQDQLTAEMKASVEYLSSISLDLIRSEITNDTKAINNILRELSERNSRLEKMVAAEASVYNQIRPGINLSYILNFFLIVGLLTIVSVFAPNYALPIIIIGSILGFLAIGIFQMRDNEKLKDESFAQIIIELLRSLRILK